MRLNIILSVIATVVVISAASVFLYSYLDSSGTNYANNLKYSITASPIGFDYSCNERVYSVYLTLANAGNESVQHLSLSVTNGICEGAVPPIPSTLVPAQSLAIYLYSDVENGTVTVSGNNTFLTIKF